MHFVVIEKGAQLDGRDYPDPKPLPGVTRRGYTAHGVVVGEGDGIEPAAGGGLDYLLWWKYPVRRGGVSVQVDEPRPSRRTAHRL